MNTACSSSLVALDKAVKDVRQGVCSSAIVAGVNVLCHPGISKQLQKLGMLSPNGRCASFDEEGKHFLS
jgi:acyl transferase domain-containing protein